MRCIAVDYDETFTDDPALWGAFIQLAQAKGYRVLFVTYRHERGDNVDIRRDAETLGIPVTFTNGKQKQHVVAADIWIDDSPETIPHFDALVTQHDHCVVTGDQSCPAP